jgi:hypothetical protein
MSGLGCGDLCILTERQLYMDNASLHSVQIWTKDSQLLAYSSKQ